MSPADYLKKVHGIIQSRALKTNNVDWKAAKAKSFELASGAKSTADTYVAINYVLAQLGDNHSFLIGRNGQGTNSNRSSVPTKPRERAKPTDTIQQDGRIYGFIVVREFGGSNNSSSANDFAASLQKKIVSISQRHADGWIVDLRGNGGGNMWPMIAGIGPLLGAGIVGFFKYSNVTVPWFYDNGEAGVIMVSKGRHANFKLADSIRDIPERSPVAVLIDGVTASSGEAIAISFQGRPNCRFFGQPTRGLSTSNEQFKLPDGAMLYLTTSVEADRNGVVYESGITPDVLVEEGDAPLGDAPDPILQAAISWLGDFAASSTG